MTVEDVISKICNFIQLRLTSQVFLKFVISFN